ncbi:nucleoside deaminase [Marinoscillum sp. MHG1-6]|uniref:nucleoside deaminase n=1 Tax=Marinoscillum sp. MHG1-6 TaxID=2959627 RepID=UPI0021582D95|nr:nucleoside deaminase [Marinoscillum sp. MHG1-6]
MSDLSIYSDDHFMKLAFFEAEKAFEDGEIPVGAVVVCQNRVIAKAYNQVQKLNDVTAHAEMLAITAAQNFLGSKYLDECTLYVTLEPCVMCGGALYWSQIKKVVFGARDESRGYQRLSENILHPKTEIMNGIMEQECSELVKSFFRKMRGNDS